MKITSSSHLLALAGTALLALAAAPSQAHAAFVFTLTQTGGNVVLTGTGTLDTTALTPAGSGSGQPTSIYPAGGALLAGPVGSPYAESYDELTGPTSFGSGSVTGPSSGSGSVVGVFSYFLFVPSGYVSGTPLADTDTFTGATFDSLGFKPGTYTYTWGTGADADSLTITGVAPEPSTWAMLGVGAAGLGLTLRRRRLA